MGKNYYQLWKEVVESTKNYIKENRLDSMILGISGGIDSAIVAAICNEVVKEEPSIKFITRSLPISNSSREIELARSVGSCFCKDFKEVRLTELYNTTHEILFSDNSKTNKISEGNIKARLRMIYLYNLAQTEKGIVMDTDNKTEYLTGFFTIHGDVGDFAPIFNLWKTEVFNLASWLIQSPLSPLNDEQKDVIKSIALEDPTDGNGGGKDLDQFGVRSFKTLDHILSTACLGNSDDSIKTEMSSIEIRSVVSRFKATSFKRTNRKVIEDITHKDKVGNLLIIIDPNNDFVDPNGSLYVPGADEKVNNLSDFLKESTPYNNILVTLDNHPRKHIGHSSWWKQNPKPGTIITLDDIKSDKFSSVNPNITKDNLVSYFEVVKSHTIWPDHCIEGTQGSKCCEKLRKTLIELSRDNHIVTIHKKGSDHNKEMYSAFEVADGSCINIPNNIITLLANPNVQIGITGFATDYCVKETVMSMARMFGDDIFKRITLYNNYLAGIDEDNSLKFLDYCKSQGATVV